MRRFLADMENQYEMNIHTKEKLFEYFAVQLILYFM